MKRLCKNCKWFVWRDEVLWDNEVYTRWDCNNVRVLERLPVSTMAYMTTNGRRWATDMSLNPHNTCPHYKRKLWKFWMWWIKDDPEVNRGFQDPTSNKGGSKPKPDSPKPPNPPRGRKVLR